MTKTIRMATLLIAVALMSGASFFAHAQNNQAPAAQSWNTLLLLGRSRHSPPTVMALKQPSWTRRLIARSTRSRLTCIFTLR